MIAKLKHWLRKATAPEWLVPVRLRTRQKIGMFTRRPGATVWVPFGRGLAMNRDGRGVLLLAGVDLETGAMRDPLAPPPRPPAFRGLSW